MKSWYNKLETTRSAIRISAIFIFITKMAIRIQSVTKKMKIPVIGVKQSADKSNFKKVHGPAGKLRG